MYIFMIDKNGSGEEQRRYLDVDNTVNINM